MLNPVAHGLMIWVPIVIFIVFLIFTRRIKYAFAATLWSVFAVAFITGKSIWAVLVIAVVALLVSIALFKNE